MRIASRESFRRLARWCTSILLLAAVSLPVSPLRAQSGTAITVERGIGNGTGMWRLGVQRDWREWILSAGWTLMLAWDVQFGRWAAQSSRASQHPIAELGVTPVVRLESRGSGRVVPFIEGAVGAHLISRNRVHAALDMSSAYQFGDHVGFGVRLGRTQWLEIAFRHQHLSNASTVQPNHGVNFNILRVAYFLR